MSILLFFVDGIGLGEDDERTNPFSSAHLPTLHRISGGRRWLKGQGPWQSEWARMWATDAQMGVPGRPQSASGQAALLSGCNVPAYLGEHYGPRPDARIRQLLRRRNLFLRFASCGMRVATWEAYPPSFYQALDRGRRLPASLQYAALVAGLQLRNAEDLRRGEALPGDFTGAAWRQHFDAEFPTLTRKEAGMRLARLARDYDFSMFSYWWTDVVGHRGDLAQAVAQLELLDDVLAGLLAEWNREEDTLILTSDHGNLEAMDHGKHTENEIPTLVYGAGRDAFREPISLQDIAPAIEKIAGIAEVSSG
ncbi:MAG: alkaline phosphatase family protein [Chloroflexi bacterium]|nr:alkaline phosphatase family protein [Chloroflexota bacterium]